MRLILHLANLFLRGTALMLCLVGATAGLACLGGAFSDKLDILTHAAPIWLACGLAGLALAAAVSRDGERKALVGIGLVGVIAVLALMTPELLSTLQRPGKPAPDRSGEDASTLKVIQFNLWADNHDPEATVAWILKQDADVVVMEEANAQGWPVVRALKKAYPHAMPCRFKYGCDTRIVSRWPILESRDLYADGRNLAGAWATLHHPRGDFTVVGAHFVWPIPAGRWRTQSQMLTASIAPFAKDSLIVTGDFNSTPWSWGLRRQDKALGLERRTHALASWPAGRFSRLFAAPFPLLPIDHVYAGQAWKTVKVERGPVLGSDHRPVVVTLVR
jgi:endonuclease/exonuclease/phosphatase (EEP) superfamily protein YafD